MTVPSVPQLSDLIETKLLGQGANFPVNIVLVLQQDRGHKQLLCQVYKEFQRIIDTVGSEAREQLNAKVYWEIF